MKTNTNGYRGYRFPREIISHSVWLYHRFSLSFRDVEELLAKRGIIVSYETIRQWCRKFGPEYARKLTRRQGRAALSLAGRGPGWRSDRHPRSETSKCPRGQTVPSQAPEGARKRTVAAGDGQAEELLGSAQECHAFRGPRHATVCQQSGEVSHQPTRRRERLMRRFKSAGQPQRFLSVHGVVQNLFRLGRHHLRSAHYRLLRSRSSRDWLEVTGV